MKKITLENGKTIEISEESYQALVDAVKEPNWEDVVAKYMDACPLTYAFQNWEQNGRKWLNDEQMQNDWKIFLYMLLWQKTYDADFVPDWESREQAKFYVYHHHAHKTWIVEWTLKRQDPMTVYFSTEEKAKRCIEDLKRIGVIA